MKMLRIIASLAALASVLCLLSGCDFNVPEYKGDYPGLTTLSEDLTPPKPEIGYRREDVLPDSVPVLRIDTETGESVDTRDHYFECTAGLEATEKYSFESLPASVRCRGNFSFYGTGVDKKSYRLKFDKAINLLGLGQGKSKNWVLLANFPDRSLLRNTAVFAMADLLDFSFVSASTFVHLYINGEDLGIYQLCEHPTINFARVNLENDPTVTDTDYLIELDNRAYKTGTAWVDYFPAAGNQFVIKNESHTPGAFYFLSCYFEDLYSAVEEGDRDSVEAFLDVDSFVDMYLLQEIVKNYDVGWASFYMIKKSGGPVYCTFPWDFDLSLGNDTELDGGSYEGLYVGNPDYLGTKNCNTLLTKLYSLDWFADLCRLRYEEIGGKLKNAALYEISRYYHTWGKELEENFRVWDVLGKYFFPLPGRVYTLNKYSELYSDLYYWIENRFDWLDEYFAVGQ